MTEPAPQEPRAPRWRAKLLVGLVVVIVAAIIARQSLTSDEADAKAGQGNQLVAGDTTEEKEPGALEKILPYITEAGSVMLLGYMLALATRSVFKLVILALVFGFIALQFLAYKGILTVDLGEFAAWVGDNVFNVSAGADAGQMAQEKVPTAGAGMLGYLLGLKKG